jgi:hypothetical protein
MEDVHQQQFGGKLCGRDLVLEESLETGLESCAELHGGKKWSVFSGQLSVKRSRVRPAAAGCRFLSGQLAGRSQVPVEAVNREQARGEKAAASCRTPDGPTHVCSTDD